LKTPHQEPLVSFLTVNFNQAAITLQLLDSLKHLQYPRWEIIVVDNGSQPSSLEQDCQRYPRTIFLRSEQNLGFAGGNNYGLASCQGDFIFLINNDTEIPPDFLEPILQLFEQHPEIGAVSPRIRYYDQPDTLQYAGFTALHPLTLRNKAIGYQEKDQPRYQQSYPTEFLHGAAMCVRRSVLEEVGPMYDGYFLYYEELDWAQRIKNAGYSLWFCGASYLLHKESVSTGKNSPLKMYYLTRNRLLFARRNLKSGKLMLAWIYFTFIALPKNLLVLALQREGKLLRAYLRGYFWNYRHSATKPLSL